MWPSVQIKVQRGVHLFVLLHNECVILRLCTYTSMMFSYIYLNMTIAKFTCARHKHTSQSRMSVYLFCRIWLALSNNKNFFVVDVVGVISSWYLLRYRSVCCCTAVVKLNKQNLWFICIYILKIGVALSEMNINFFLIIASWYPFTILICSYMYW